MKLQLKPTFRTARQLHGQDSSKGAIGRSSCSLESRPHAWGLNRSYWGSHSTFQSRNTITSTLQFFSVGSLTLSRGWYPTAQKGQNQKRIFCTLFTMGRKSGFPEKNASVLKTGEMPQIDETTRRKHFYAAKNSTRTESFQLFLNYIHRFLVSALTKFARKLDTHLASSCATVVMSTPISHTAFLKVPFSLHTWCRAGMSVCCPHAVMAHLCRVYNKGFLRMHRDPQHALWRCIRSCKLTLAKCLLSFRKWKKGTRPTFILCVTDSKCLFIWSQDKDFHMKNIRKKLQESLPEDILI